ncbi:MAG TPA: hypothetical protein VFM98_04180 [Ramlibacter sp.]|uniref:hypothetical protein n=1 Tax=Ramlibacter sp. TaxID=1917967 RepID=UPI002D806228|nr:hypothetical protein [Ramlibacter sp.]HET8744780.1 hypothetical protein [Ramlibacter sp.]
MQELLERRNLLAHPMVVGLLSALVFAIVGLLLRGNPAAPAVAAVATLGAALLLTGAAQESAVFRLAAVLGQPASGHGTMTLVLLLAGRIATVAAIGAASEAGVLAALLAGPVVARFAPLLAAHWSAHEGSEDAAGLRAAALWCVLPLAVMLLAEGVAFVLLALAGAALAWIALLRFLRSRPGGFDELRAGALQQACELAFYLGASVGA